jgi:alkanesulfonate monooxygenase SsuD/methylene tetrahydromethanopterin reductase-like flavin-dependent oxidoreductase (luciferase family)
VFDETLEILRRLWSEEEVTFRGQFYRLDGVRLGLRPRQDPLPLWVASGLFHAGQSGVGPYGDREVGQERRGWRAPQERVARLGDGFLSTQATPAEFGDTLAGIRELAGAKFGREPGSIAGVLSLGVFVDHDLDRAFGPRRRRCAAGSRPVSGPGPARTGPARPSPPGSGLPDSSARSAGLEAGGHGARVARSRGAAALRRGRPARRGPARPSSRSRG